jgi:hypothetical protein
MNISNFLAAITPEAKSMILTTIAKHYGISVAEAYDEVVDPEAECLLDYLTGSSRLATSVLMQKHGFKDKND